LLGFILAMNVAVISQYNDHSTAILFTRKGAVGSKLRYYGRTTVKLKPYYS